MRRERISGFHLGRLTGLHIEVVTRNGWPVVVALWNGRKFIKRIEKRRSSGRKAAQ